MANVLYFLIPTMIIAPIIISSIFHFFLLLIIYFSNIIKNIIIRNIIWPKNLILRQDPKIPENFNNFVLKYETSENHEDFEVSYIKNSRIPKEIVIRKIRKF